MAAVSRDDSRFLLMSVRQPFAEAIMDGRKTVEIRRGFLRLRADETLAVYAAKKDQHDPPLFAGRNGAIGDAPYFPPRGAVVGLVRIESVRMGRPDVLWQSVAKHAWLEREQYDRYLRNAHVATSIELIGLSRFTRPVTLEALQSEWPGFYAPRTVIHLSPHQVAWLIAQGVPSVRVADSDH